jgi:hypothetical protein
MTDLFLRSLRLAAALLVAGAVFLSSCGLSATALPTLTPGPQDFVKSYESAFNNKDLEGLMALHSDQIQFSLPEWETSFGTYEAVKNAYGLYFAVNTEIHLSACQMENESVKCQLTYAEDILRASGLKDYAINAVFTFEAGKIKSIIWNDPNTSSQAYQDLDKFEDNFFDWWRKTYPEQANQILVSIPAFYLPENGPILEQRLKEYTETLKK